MATDTELSERFARLWTRFQPEIAQFIAAVVPDPHQADDVLQEVAVAILRKFSDYDDTRPFVAWAIGIARFEVAMSRRRHARDRLVLTPEALDAVADACVELAPEVDGRSRALRTCLDQVDGRAREMLRLRYEQALSPQEMAARAGVDPGAVRVILHRVRAALLRCIERRLAGAG
ncbi:MAG TPA: sigma-70 family RNA polymerase sigma factor [Planctomycetota bacterium]|nr:sigma-70 family RNA polymerase sigma factor [Planctomycetota bacterium]